MPRTKPLSVAPWFGERGVLRPEQGEYEEVRVLLKLGFPRMFTSDASEGFLCRDKTLSLSLMKRWKMTRMHWFYYCSFDRFLISVIVSIIFVVAAECTWYVKGCKRERERVAAASSLCPSLLQPVTKHIYSAARSTETNVKKTTDHLRHNFE